MGLVIANDVMDQNEIDEENIDPNEILIKKPWDGLFKEIISDKNQIISQIKVILDYMMLDILMIMVFYL